MHTRPFAFLICATLSAFTGGALAQAASNYDGTWKIGFDGKAMGDLEGTVVIKGEGGSWHMIASAKRNPCVGREAPIAVKSATDSELIFDVNRSTVLTGCKDWTMKLKKVDDKTLQGTFTDGRIVTLQRQ